MTTVWVVTVATDDGYDILPRTRIEFPDEEQARATAAMLDAEYDYTAAVTVETMTQAEAADLKVWPSNHHLSK